MIDPALEFIDVVKTFGAGSTEVKALGGVSLRAAGPPSTHEHPRRRLTLHHVMP